MIHCFIPGYAHSCPQAKEAADVELHESLLGVGCIAATLRTLRDHDLAFVRKSIAELERLMATVRVRLMCASCAPRPRGTAPS